MPNTERGQNHKSQDLLPPEGRVEIVALQAEDRIEAMSIGGYWDSWPFVKSHWKKSLYPESPYFHVNIGMYGDRNKLIGVQDRTIYEGQMTIEGKVSTVRAETIQKRSFIDAQVFTIEELEQEDVDRAELISEMQERGLGRVVKSRADTWHPFREEDSVIALDDLPSELKNYEELQPPYKDYNDGRRITVVFETAAAKASLSTTRTIK